MGLLGRFGITIDGREVVVAAVKFCLLLGPQRLQRHHGFPGLSPAVVEVAAHERGLLPVPPGANAKNKAPMAVQVQHGNLFGENQRIAFGHECDPGGQLDPTGDGSGHGQGNIRLREVAIGPGNLTARGGEGAGAIDG